MKSWLTVSILACALVVAVGGVRLFLGDVARAQGMKLADKNGGRGTHKDDGGKPKPGSGSAGTKDIKADENGGKGGGGRPKK